MGFEKGPDQIMSNLKSLGKNLQIKFPFLGNTLTTIASLCPKRNRKHLHILCICFNWISVVSGDVQELEVSRKENELENSCSDISEEHRLDELQGKLTRTS